MSKLCKCGRPREKRAAGPSSNFPGREYYRCDTCGKFDWAADTASFGSSTKRSDDELAGPVCNCGTATVQRAVKKAGPNKGRKFWSCASWPRGCKFFEWKTESTGSCPSSTSVPTIVTPEQPTKKRPALPGYASYETDWKRKELLQKLLDSGVDHAKLRSQSGGSYDGFELVAAWNIHNPTRKESYDQAVQREKHKIAKDPIAKTAGDNDGPYNLETTYKDVIEELGNDLLAQGEVFLLHGTDPRNLHSILFEGLDPEVSRNGTFGRGVYFAENAAKIDQYAIADERFDKDGNLNELHQKLYEHQMHPRRVRYCLVARVVLGRTQRTQDGRTVMGTKKLPLYQDDNHSERTRLKPFEDGVQPSSLIGEVGGVKSAFREFVVFQPDQIFVQYVIAYRRARKFCDCNRPLVERTVTKQTENRGRKIFICGAGKESGCGFIRMLPFCHCFDSAVVKTSGSVKNPNRKYYTCRKKRCEFFEWCEAVVGSPSPYKRQRTT
ncbi:Ankyrin Repeat Protein [Seminavis robusta]|uniref:Ankyrin Repeat Protein n=1 Tax=Seminavis robusta TaxID=568900 RepID=A0A9N8D663_9STRA|nr:Ankyrin Repeat Protein [Seminavis robusta]|eukprot:Sro15_g011310.1 Ankyrin Repeat Protein (495) ;mRNA; f:132627-134193